MQSMLQHVFCLRTSFRECVLFGDCLISYRLTKCLCSFCTEIDIPTLKCLARHTGFN